MTSIIQMLKQISESEVRKLHLLELGVVESIDIHSSDSDAVNYECSVIFPGRKTPDGVPLKMEHVPIMTPHTGMVNIPYINDLVLVGFLGGDFSLPVVLGRLHTAEKRAPVYEDGQFLLRMDPDTFDKDGASGAHVLDIVFPNGTEIHVEKELLTVTIGKTFMKINLDGDIEMVSEANVLVTAKENLNIQTDGDISMKAKGEINMKADGNVNVKGKRINLN